MAGYLGTKAVLLSTTAADVVGNAEIGGDLTVGGAFTSQGIDDNASATAMTLDASGNVGIGTSSPDAPLHILGTTGTPCLFLQGSDQDLGYSGEFQLGEYTGSTYTERMRIDASGHFLFGTNDNTPSSNSSNTSSDNAVVLRSDGRLEAAADKPTTNAGAVGYFNRTGTDGGVLALYRSGAHFGTIGVRTAGGYKVLVVTFDSGNSGVGLTGTSPSGNAIIAAKNGTSADNVVNLGVSAIRFDNIYATNGTIQTSDRNEKQDIEALSDAEQRVAVACKGLLRKFRWKDRVAEKGDDARIHFGIIAQDLQDAFAAEGLDAGRYAMFISSTWWETQTEVPAVEAVAEVLDEDGNVVTEAVEAKDAYTRTDTYETLEEAPEGATERTRLGVRYPELLAFIIGAM